MKASHLAWPAAVLLAAAASGCSGDDPNALTGDGGNVNPYCNTTGSGGGNVGSGGSGGDGTGGAPPVTPQTVLEQRELSYTEALRTASFKLVGNAPTLEQIESLRVLENETEQAARYEELIDEMLDDDRFKVQMIHFWRNTFRQGGGAVGNFPSRDTAPMFAARLTVEGQPFTELFTRTSNTCPTFDGTDFQDGDCNNGPVTAGVLTDPGSLAQYYGNLAFRRTRFIQETFACRKQPSELSNTPVPMGAGTYTSPWPFTSISGEQNGGRIDFLDTESAICANCHGTSNHRSPLFAYFDANGQYQPDISVFIPIEGEPLAEFSDWLPPGETTAWKLGQPAADLAEFGAHMAQDEEVLQCAVSRVWNLAFSKGDIVNDAASIPTSVIQPVYDDFVASNYNLRETVRAVFLHDDFVRF